MSASPPDTLAALELALERLQIAYMAVSHLLSNCLSTDEIDPSELAFVRDHLRRAFVEGVPVAVAARQATPPAQAAADLH